VWVYSTSVLAKFDAHIDTIEFSSEASSKVSMRLNEEVYAHAWEICGLPTKF